MYHYTIFASLKTQFCASRVFPQLSKTPYLTQLTQCAIIKELINNINKQMTKKAIIEKVVDEIIKCADFGKDDDGVLNYQHPPMAQGTYQDGLIFALELLQGRKINK